MSGKTDERTGAAGGTETAPAETGATGGGKAPTIPLTDGVEWVAESYELGPDRAVHVSVYLIRGPRGNVLVDSGSFYHRESIRDRVSRATEGEGIRALILSHSDYPHSANIGAFRERWGDFEIVASSGEPAVQGLPYARRSRIGEELEVAGRRFRFLDPPLADRSHTTWIYDLEDRVLFAADGFGAYHRPGDHHLTSPEIPHGIRGEDVLDFHRDTLGWLRYVAPPRLEATFQSLFRENPAAWVAPIHGPPIAAADLDGYLELLVEAVRRIAGEYRVPPADG